MKTCKNFNIKTHIKNTLSLIIALIGFFTINVYADNTDLTASEEIEQSLNNIKTYEDIYQKNFNIDENQSFDVEFENLGKMKFIIARYNKYGRIAVFLVNEKKEVIYKTFDLEINESYCSGIRAVSFRDVNNDSLKDIIIISSAMTTTGLYEATDFDVADILFQNENGFSRNYEITKKLNDYDMNKNVEMIMDYMKGKKSKELLYNASTLDELENYEGFKIIEDQSFEVDFESLGEMKVVSAEYEIGGLKNVFIYITNQQGDILESINPMIYYDNFKKVKGVSFADINGDSLKDIIFLAEYFDYQNSKSVSCNVYFQNQKYFYSNYSFDRDFSVEASDTLQDIIDKARQIFKNNIENWLS